jgi:hypothetical protein
MANSAYIANSNLAVVDDTGALLYGLPSVPAVFTGLFSLTLPVHAGQVVGVMTATNSPTSWSITAGNPGGFYTIDNLGNISITPAGATGIVAGPASLTVQACSNVVPAGDPYFSNVVLLMGYEGANLATGAPGMTDESSHAHGTATVTASYISTTSEKFGSSSLYSANQGGTTNAVITFPNNADWQLGSGLFTIEMWVSCDSSIGGFGGYLAALWGASGNFSWVLCIQGQKLTWVISTDGTTTHADIGGFSSIPFGTPGGPWTHVAIDFDGSKYRSYINGTMDASFTTPRTLFNSTAPLSIGNNYNGSNGLFGGFIDELRITKGVARYASDAGFAVPTAPFPRS